MRYQPKPALVRVQAGGGFDEWFDLDTRQTVGLVWAQRDAADGETRASVTLSHCIADWSLVDEAGAKLPITPETCKALDEELVAPVWAELGRVFLARQSRLQPTSQDESPAGSTAVAA